ncbi:IS30 family transposase [Paraburkholderia panacisoli]|uniref:IS30 family transposase n=1 Tax=Paraburkholderia panacisoli TaxID=2603818 RepID=UPI001FE6BA94|nr:IS30 family transposase [Paraburkholderia panacisoli]
MHERTQYQQLQPEERLIIASLHLQGSSMRAMARILGRSPATVSRELTRNSSPAGYVSVPAEALSAARRSAGRRPAKLCLQSVCWRIVLTVLEWKWSPRQISGTLKRIRLTRPSRFRTKPSTRPSTPSRAANYAPCLRQGHITRMPRTQGTDRRGQIPDMISIHVRPPEIEDRPLPGHWEGDFIKGAGNQSSVGVLVERTSRLVLLAKMEDATAASALAGISAKLNSIAEPLRQSFTYDQGKEMSRHRELTAATGVKVYFCDPHSPWQRGTCEHTNGLLRQYLPKGTDLSVYRQDELDAIADSLNSRPRATHAFHSPFEVFAATLASASQPQGS